MNLYLADQALMTCAFCKRAAAFVQVFDGGKRYVCESHTQGGVWDFDEAAARKEARAHWGFTPNDTSTRRKPAPKGTWS